MITQLVSKEVENYIKNNPKSILLDVRTEEEWNTDGKPDGEKIGLKTYFLTIKDENFIEDFKKLIKLYFYNLLYVAEYVYFFQTYNDFPYFLYIC